MIDANDKHTGRLDLGVEPKKRGRPPTGAALSGAERQRAYRERQQKIMSRDDNSELRLALKAALDDVEDLRMKLRVELEMTHKAQSKAVQLELRVNELEAELASRRTMIGSDRVWRMQYKVKGARNWTTTRSIDGMQEDEAFLKVRELVAQAAGSDRNSQWRAIREDGVIFNPKDCK
ncbi:putative uncharacterized protein [Pseudomonas sp. StFLB209]|uniref:hypothetical protein n=1 Tax=Pseudomonas sp. StFLB209 TaxID=1028989 RepID=UPI0004F8B11D|nr:hypothetical protein [Pseudomonas sp. StFLB209]BAP41282.1 putative uncharacterized protein [Pseudomonas sp. StFLB209]